jgi:hypothetical protein
MADRKRKLKRRLKRRDAEIRRLKEALLPFAFEDCQTTQKAWEIRYLDRFKDWIDFGSIKAARKALGFKT